MTGSWTGSPSPLSSAGHGWAASTSTNHARAALRTVQALAISPHVAQFTAKVRSLGDQGVADYTTPQAAYDLRKLRAKALIDKPGRSRGYQVPATGARTVSALLTLRDHVIVPILAGIRSLRMGRKPSIWTPADRHYEQLRVGMQALFNELGIAAAAWTILCRSRIGKTLNRWG